MVLGSQSSRQKLLSEDLRKALVRSEKNFGHSYERDVDEIYPTLQNPHENIDGTFKKIISTFGHVFKKSRQTMQVRFSRIYKHVLRLLFAKAQSYS